MHNKHHILPSVTFHFVITSKQLLLVSCLFATFKVLKLSANSARLLTRDCIPIANSLVVYRGTNGRNGSAVNRSSATWEASRRGGSPDGAIHGWLTVDGPCRTDDLFANGLSPTPNLSSATRRALAHAQACRLRVRPLCVMRLQVAAIQGEEVVRRKRGARPTSG